MDRIAAMATVLVLVTATVSAALVPATAVTPAASHATAADGAGHSPVPTDNSTARLVVPREEFDASGMGSVQPDLGSALSTAGDDLDRRNFRLTVEARFEAANSTNARVIVMDQALIELEAESAALLDRQNTTIRSYANGSIGEPELLRRLAHVDQTARDLLETVSYLRDRSNEMEGHPLSDTIGAVGARLETLKGPVRNEVAETLDGTDSMGGIYVQVSGPNLVLATVEDGQYLREAYVISNRETEGFPELETNTEALNRHQEYYPWVWNNSVSAGAGSLGDVHRTTQIHPQGELVAYFDAYSGEVIYEIQRLDIGAIPTTTVRNASTGGLQVLVERTYPGGPMRIKIYDAATGNPVNARVSVDGVEVGPTEQGAVWTVEPRTAYEIDVETPRTSTNVTVTPPPAE